MGGRLVRGVIAAVVAIVAAGLGCRGPAAAPAADDTASLVHAAVLRYEAKHFLGEERMPICVAVHGSADGVGARVREALQPTLLDVRLSEACAIVDGDVYLAGSRVPAALLTSGPIRWIAADEAEVSGGFTRARSSSQRPVYRVVREAERWVCLGPIVTGLPL